MPQNQRFLKLIERSEDCVLSTVLSEVKSSKNTDYLNLINYSWGKSISSFTTLISNSNESTLINTQLQNKETDNNNLDLKNFIELEIYNLRTNKIASHVYLVYLKIFRKTYKDLILSQDLQYEDKIDDMQRIDASFDRIETTFIKTLNRSNSSSPQVPLPHTSYGDQASSKYLENLIHPVIIVDKTLSILENNSVAINKLPYLFCQKNTNLNSFEEKPGLKILASKISDLENSSKEVLHFETYIESSKSQIWYLINIKKISNSGNKLILLVDLNNWKNMKDRLIIEKKSAEESNRLKTSFLANMSHEIRTPMNAIVGFSELLSMSDPTAEERNEYLGLIRHSSNDLLNIIEDIIDVAKIESKQLKISYQNTKLSEIFNDLFAIYNKELVKYGKDQIKLIQTIPDKETELALRTDYKRLKQVLSNLIGNAIKFTESGQIEFGFKKAHNNYVYFFVKDTGIGIPKDNQKNIFDRFVQVESSFQKNQIGSGLGLTISRNLIHLLGGKIWLSSKFEEGSSFYFYLPYIPISKEIQNIQSSDSEEEVTFKVDYSNKTILIAEDVDINYYYLERLLINTGAKIIRAKNGIEAINYADRENFDLILMDIRMPELDGLEAARYISTVIPKTPVIALSAYAMDEDINQCLRAGCKAYLSKPVSGKKLIETLNEYLCAEKKLTKKREGSQNPLLP